MARFFAALGHVMALWSHPPEGEVRALKVVEFDKLGDLVLRLVQPDQPTPPKMDGGPLDILPGFRGHGVGVRAQRGRPLYLSDLMKELADKSCKLVEVTGPRRRRKVVGVVEQMAKAPFLETDITTLGLALRQLEPDEIRAVGTHCTPELLIMDIGLQMDYGAGHAIAARDASASVDDREDGSRRFLINVDEAVRKAFRNEAFYETGRSKLLRQMPPSLLERFQDTFAPASEIWGGSMVSDLRDEAFLLGAMMEAMHEEGVPFERVPYDRRIVELREQGYGASRDSLLRSIRKDGLDATILEMGDRGHVLKDLGADG